MSVAELIDRLSECHPGAEVWVEVEGDQIPNCLSCDEPAYWDVPLYLDVDQLAEQSAPQGPGLALRLVVLPG